MGYFGLSFNGLGLKNKLIIFFFFTWKLWRIIQYGHSTRGWISLSREKTDEGKTSDLDFPLRKIQQKHMIRALIWRRSFDLQLGIFLMYYFNIVNQG